jgi:hypothetical protein
MAHAARISRRLEAKPAHGGRGGLTWLVGGFRPDRSFAAGDLEPVIAEIVTNRSATAAPAARSSSPPLPSRTACCVQVTDDGAGLVPSPGAMSSEEHGGFGLVIVGRLTRRWGMTQENRRTRVWFEFDYEGARS